MAAIWTASLMLDHLGEPPAAEATFQALRAIVREDRLRTPDLGGRRRTAEVGGRRRTAEVGDAVVEALQAAVPHVEAQR